MSTTATDTGGTGFDIDWSSLHQRVVACHEAMSRDFAPTPAALNAMLRARTMELARTDRATDAGESAANVIEFSMAHERYGVELEYVREVSPLRELTPIPCTPAFVLGVVNIRGRILSLVDLKKFFGLPDKGLADLNRVIVVHGGHLEFGVLADTIAGVRHVPLQMIQNDFPTLTGVRKEYLKGVTGDGAIILDVRAILADPGIVVCEREDS